MGDSISHNKLLQFLTYDSCTGDFFWKRKPNRRICIGDKVGRLRSDGYIGIRLFGKDYLAHRLAWLYVYCEWPDGEIDHINHKRNDNSISNIRDVSRSHNHRNRKLHPDSKFGLHGIKFDNRDNMYYASITVNGNSEHLKCSKDFFEACCARKSAEHRYGFHENHGTRGY